MAMGPNIKYVAGAYWDFWDHYLPLTELSLSEGMRSRGFQIEVCRPRFLPYTMVKDNDHEAGDTDDERPMWLFHLRFLVRTE